MRFAARVTNPRVYAGPERLWDYSTGTCDCQREWRDFRPDHLVIFRRDPSQKLLMFRTVLFKDLSVYAKVISEPKATFFVRFDSLLKPDKSPEERGDLVLSTELFTKIHLDSSALGQTLQPTSEDDGMNTDLHFTCFVAAPDGDVRKAAAERQHTLEIGSTSGGSGATASQSASEPSGLSPGDAIMAAPSQPIGKIVASGIAPADGQQLEGMRLIELDGRRSLPVDHGPCVDVLDVRAPPLLSYDLP